MIAAKKYIHITGKRGKLGVEKNNWKNGCFSIQRFY